MKKMIAPILWAFTLTALLFTACRKPTEGNHHPQPTPSSKLFRFVVDSLPGATGQVAGVTALVSIANQSNELVVTNKRLSLTYNGKYTSENLELPNGSYRLVKFLILNESRVAKYATPVTGSARASEVQQPLAIAYSLPQSSLSTLPVQVLRINDKEEAYGYPAGAFNNPAPGDGGQTPPGDEVLKIRMRVILKIGEIKYDSLPVGLRFTVWDDKNERTTRYISLKAGTNEVELPKEGQKFEFGLDRWGIQDQLTLQKSEIRNGAFYTLGGTKAAKKLTSELTYVLVDGQYKAQSKNAYQYDGKGRLTQILYYQKKADQTPYIAMTEKFTYTENKVDKIVRYDEHNNQVGNITFSYDEEGRVKSMSNNDNGGITNAEVVYGTHEPFEDATISYTYPGKTITMSYNMRYYGGNLFAATASTSNGNWEDSKYDYDNSINPYAHMNWPDLFLSHQSKNNVSVQYSQYFGSYPTGVPYNFRYTYDADGYPKELVRSYRSAVDNRFLYTTKTVYNY